MLPSIMANRMEENMEHEMESEIMLWDRAITRATVNRVAKAPLKGGNRFVLVPHYSPQNVP